MASKRTTVKIGRHTLTLQDPGVGWVLDMEERCINPATGRTSLKLYAEELLKHVVVDPQGLTIEDFDHEDELLELVRVFKQFRRSEPATRKEKPAGAGKGDNPA